MRWVQFTYAAVLGLLILPFIVLRDLWVYKSFLAWGHVKEKGWGAVRSFFGGAFQSVMGYWSGMKVFIYEYKCVRFRWMPLHYVRHTSAWDESCYCRVLYGGVIWWGSFGTGPGYIGGYAIVLTGCLDGWKFNGLKTRNAVRRLDWWSAIVLGRA